MLRLLNLISNALYGADTKYKKAFLEAGLALVVRRLLLRPALQQHTKRAEPLLRAALKVLINLVARSPEGARTMAQCGKDTTDATLQDTRASSLLQLTIAACNLGIQEKGGRGLTVPPRVLQPGVSMLDEANESRGDRLAHKAWLHDYMSILASCVLCAECMPVILKSNVTASSFALLIGAADAKDSSAAIALLDFLVAMSRVPLGQTAILKVPSALVTMSATRGALLNNGQVRKRCSLLLHNLCFCAEAKAHILASDHAMRAIIGDLDAASSAHVAASAHCRAHAANSLWSLVYNNQKALPAIKVNHVRLGARRMSILSWLVHQHDSLQVLPSLLQHNATHCDTLQHTVTHSNTLQHDSLLVLSSLLQHTATHCNILQHTATHCNILQCTPTSSNTTLSRCSRVSKIPCHTDIICVYTFYMCTPHCNALQHTAIHCNTMPCHTDSMCLYTCHVCLHIGLMCLCAMIHADVCYKSFVRVK